MKMNDLQILIQALIDRDVDAIFGYPGGPVLNIYDVLYERSEDIRYIIASHEQGAAHAADDYARSTGKCGVCLATSGPGATNLVIGVATAYVDSVPMVAITSNAPSNSLGRDPFQEVNIAGTTIPITRHNFIVQSVKDLAVVAHKAFVIANSRRKGPALIDIPKDATAAHSEYVKLPCYRTRKLSKVDSVILEQALEVVRRAERLMIYAGGGIVSSNATEELMNLSRHMDIPIYCSMMELGSVPYDYDLYIDMPGIHGILALDYVVLNTDLVIAIGSRFSDRVAGSREEFGRGAKIIHLDIDASEVSKNVVGDISIIGDTCHILKKMTQRMPEIKYGDWTGTFKGSKTKLGLSKPKPRENVDSKDLVLTLHEIVGEDATIVTNVGQHQMIMAQRYQFSHSRSWVNSCSLGATGYGTRAVTGAKAANPHHLVILVTGDGSLHANTNEIAATVSVNIPIVVLVFNNHVLGMVRQWQILSYDHRYSHITIGRQTGFVRLAEAFGGKGPRIQTRHNIEDVMKEALPSRIPCIVDCWIDKGDCVCPTIPPGKSGKDTILCGN